MQGYSSHDADILVDIIGYFTDSTAISNLVFYPITPCRVVETRTDYRPSPGPFGPQPSQTARLGWFRLPSSPHGQIPTAAAYALTLTVIPPGPLQFLSAWPAGIANRTSLKSTRPVEGYSPTPSCRPQAPTAASMSTPSIVPIFGRHHWLLRVRQWAGSVLLPNAMPNLCHGKRHPVGIRIRPAVDGTGNHPHRPDPFVVPPPHHWKSQPPGPSQK